MRGLEFGFDETFCTKDLSTFKGIVPWTMYIYYLSKFPELFDTAILALKKKPIIFLHWLYFLTKVLPSNRRYHHSIVILMVWSWLQYSFLFGMYGLLFKYTHLTKRGHSCVDVLLLFCIEFWVQCVVQKVHHSSANYPIHLLILARCDLRPCASN
jgi:GNS1/SUR4 family